jgi:hypothetical protein
MSANVSPPGKYPGVYVRTMIDAVPPTSGVGTSVGAFIGRTAQGPVNVPVTCLNFADFERRFGGLAGDSALSYQASGFFNNGGNQAEVVRLYRLIPAEITATVVATSAGTYTLTLASLGSGPTVQVSTGQTFAQTAPTSADVVYQALALELSTEPALAGLVTIESTSGNLKFSLSYPSTLSGGGPGSWTFSLSGGTGASTVSTGTGSAVVSLNSGVSFTLAGLTANQPAVLTFSPPGGAPFQVRVTAPSAGWQASDVALALFKAIKQSSAARELVSAANPGSGAVLALTYAAPVTVTLLEGSVSVKGQISSPSSGFQLSAANPGAWGNAIVAAVDTDGINQAVASKYGLAISDLFNLTVLCGGNSERFTAVTLVQSAGANRLDRVLQSGSSLVVLSDAALLGTTAPPAGCWGQAQGGQASAPLQDTDYLGDPNLKTGLYAFTQKPYAFNIMSIPPDDTTDPLGGDVDPSIYQQAAQICAENNAMLIIDPPTKWSTELAQGNVESVSLGDLGSYSDAQARACAVYFPRVIIADPLRNGLPKTVVPSGYIAAVWASVDAASGVWKAPAGLDAPIGGILQLQAKLNDDQNGVLNPLGINALRFFTGVGSVVWGARTLRGADQLGDPYKYIPVQRLLDYIETSLLQNTRWAVFQPNGQGLWAALQTQITVFMNGLFAQGAFAGTSASQAFFVKCDATTTTPTDAAAGIVNVQVGFAPLYPAEFVVITISQLTASSG